MLKAVIFDMDGVLIDSPQIGLEVRRRLLAQKYGVNPDSVPDPQEEGHRAASMKTLLASVENHTGKRIDPDEFSTLAQANMKQKLLSAGVKADTALIDFLEELKRQSIACAIASSSLRKPVDIKLDILGIRSYFSVIVTGDDVKEHKPHPETYLVACQKLRLPPSECIVIEDSATGVQAGIAAGCKIIGFIQYNPVKKPLLDTILTIHRWQDISYSALRNLRP